MNSRRQARALDTVIARKSAHSRFFRSWSASRIHSEQDAAGLTGRTRKTVFRGGASKQHGRCVTSINGIANSHLKVFLVLDDLRP